MRLWVAGIFLFFFLAPWFARAEESAPAPEDISPEDIAVIQQMEVLELMETVAQLPLLEEMDILIEETSHDSEDN